MKVQIPVMMAQLIFTRRRLARLSGADARRFYRYSRLQMCGNNWRIRLLIKELAGYSICRRILYAFQATCFMDLGL